VNITRKRITIISSPDRRISNPSNMMPNGTRAEAATANCRNAAARTLLLEWAGASWRASTGAYRPISSSSQQRGVAWKTTGGMNRLATCVLNVVGRSLQCRLSAFGMESVMAVLS
jgi:hypothetical protein